MRREGSLPRWSAGGWDPSACRGQKLSRSVAKNTSFGRPTWGEDAEGRGRANASGRSRHPPCADSGEGWPKRRPWPRRGCPPGLPMGRWIARAVSTPLRSKRVIIEWERGLF